MAGLLVLVVDDDDMMLRMLPPHLQQMATTPPVERVLTAGTPENALRELATLGGASPLAVLSDFNLKAAMNGAELLTEVARLRPDAVRVLFSGYAIDQLGAVAREAPTHGFIEKPLRIREMIPPLRDIIQRALAARAG